MKKEPLLFDLQPLWIAIRDQPFWKRLPDETGKVIFVFVYVFLSVRVSVDFALYLVLKSVEPSGQALLEIHDAGSLGAIGVVGALCVYTIALTAIIFSVFIIPVVWKLKKEIIS